MITNKQEFLDNTIQKVRELNIVDIIQDRIHLIRKGRSLLTLCPFHNDHKLGSFQISERKGIFKCFSCGKGGDAIKFIALMENINYVEAAMKIAAKFNIITISEYEWFFKKKFSDKIAQKIEKIYLDKIKADLEKIAPIETLNKIFSIFSLGESLTKKPRLSKEHKQYLLNRGLSEKDIIDGGYFTFPKAWIMKAFLKKLKADFGFEHEILKDIPGFFKKKTSDNYTYYSTKGIGIPIRNAHGKIIGIQIRRDNLKEGQSRYKWFSSSFAIFDENFSDGTSSGSPLDVFFPSIEPKNWINTIFITEGRFKAQIIAKVFKCPAISVQGVSSWRNINKAIKDIQNLHENRFKNIFVCFDADMAYNEQVFIQAKKMTDSIIKESDLNIMYCIWNSDLGKGIDDIILNRKGNMIEKISKKEYEEKYIKFKSIVEEKEGDFSKVGIEKLKEYFINTILKHLPKYKNLIN